MESISLLSQFVTDRAKVSGVFGPRYLGKHKVFAPPPDGRRSGTEYREEIPGKIFGIHGLYDYEVLLNPK
jgi:hypothetical protein